MARVRALLRRRGVRVALAWLVVLVAASGGAYVGARHAADRLHLVVRVGSRVVGGTPQPDYRVALDAVFTDAAVARGTQDAVNAIPTIPWSAAYNCGLAISNPLYAYTFTFTWHGLLVEAADGDTEGCGFWHRSAVGISEDLLGPDADGWRTLARLTGMLVPDNLLASMQEP